MSIFNQPVFVIIYKIIRDMNMKAVYTTSLFVFSK